MNDRAAAHRTGGGSTWSLSDLMIVAAARLLTGASTVLVGIGQPNLAANLARRAHNPNVVLIYESGVIGARPERVPVSIGDPALVTRAQCVLPMMDLFSFVLQGGHIDVGFLEGVQIDRFGNINTTVIGDYATPKTRLPGSGGACEIALNAKQVFVIMRQSKRSFVESLDFRTSVGSRVSVVVTDLGVYHFDGGEMRLDALHPGVSLEQVTSSMGWSPKVAAELAETPAPSAEELRLIRKELDPAGVYTK